MDETVTLWLSQPRPGRSGGRAQRIWERYYDRMVRLARKKLGAHKEAGGRRGGRGAQCLPELLSGPPRPAGFRWPRGPARPSGNCWWTITAQKAIAQIRRELLQKHGGGGAVRGESVLIRRRRHRAMGRNPGSLGQGTFARTGRDDRRTVPATFGLSAGRVTPGHRPVQTRGLPTNAKIAQKLKCARRTVEQKLNRIRERWEKVGANERRFSLHPAPKGRFRGQIDRGLRPVRGGLEGRAHAGGSRTISQESRRAARTDCSTNCWP